MNNKSRLKICFLTFLIVGKNELAFAVKEKDDPTVFFHPNDNNEVLLHNDRELNREVVALRDSIRKAQNNCTSLAEVGKSTFKYSWVLLPILASGACLTRLVFGSNN